MNARLLPTLAGLSVSVFIASGAEAQQFVRIGSGLAGTYPVYGAKLAEMINKTVPGVRASTIAGPTEQNLVRIQKGEVEMCITYTFQAAQLYEGKGELNFPTPDLRHVMSLYGSYHMAVARKGVEIDTLADLAKKPYRVWLGVKASVFWPLNTSALAAYNVVPEDIAKAGGVVNTTGYQNLQQAFQDGQVDIGFFAGPAPYSVLMQLDRNPGFRILDFAAGTGNRMTEILPGVSMAPIPAGTYQSQPAAVTAPYVFNQIVASAKMPDEIVYQITKMMNEQVKEFHTLFAGAEEIQPKTALASNKIPVHPGAERYYRETGLLR